MRSDWVAGVALIETDSLPSPPIAKIFLRTRNVTSVSQVRTSSASGSAIAIARTSSKVGIARSARLVVDLGALEAAGEVDIDRLPLGVRVEGDVSRLAVAVAGLLPATE